MEAVECGAAALAMILAYHGRYVPLEELRVACGVSRDGSKAGNVLRAARTFGLTAKGWKLEPDGLIDKPLPLIVFWEFNHFVVVEGHVKGYWYLNDPACGPRRVPDRHFDRSFTGVALVFEKGPEFRPGGHKPGLAGALWSRSKGARGALAFLVLAGLALVVPGLIIPAFSKIFVDDILVGGKTNWVRPLLLGMGLTALLRLGLTYVQQACLLRLQTRLTLSTAAAFFSHLLKLPMEFFAQRYPAEVANRTNLNYLLSKLLSGEVPTNLLNLAVIGFYAVLMAFFDVGMTAVVVGAGLVNVVAVRAAARQRKDMSTQMLAEEGKLASVAMGGLQAIETLKATGSEGDFFATWSGHQAKVLTTQQRLGFATLLLNAVPALVTGVNTAAILALGGLRVMQGYLTIGDLVAFQSLAASFMEPVTGLVTLGTKLQDAESIVGRIDDVLRHKPDPEVRADEPPPTDVPVKLAGRLDLRGITFGYSRLEPPLIEDFNLSLQPGSRVALVGDSGSGKSTVARLIAGLYSPWAGEILYDGQPRLALPRWLVTNSVAVVDQDIFLFKGTVRENLSLWDATIPESELVRAAEDACIHQVIAARPDGYDSSVAESGLNFSGGERQRLEIARALATNPTLLVLDEATSALDPVTEAAIVAQLRRRGCTCVIVAHRLSTVRDSDVILVLEQGRVVQRGTHEQLCAVSGAYRDLIKTY
jgi:NHLM bacteriocin system ABC transporter peptidase/ATP-binding protein